MIRLFATDLDGTILTSDHVFQSQDLETLHRLRKAGVVCVVATGRSLNSARQVLDDDFPIDYLVFSSGAGVYDWRGQKLLRSLHLSANQTHKISTVLKAESRSYTLHRPIPDNHCFYYHQGEPGHADFERFVTYHQDYAQPLNGGNVGTEFTQILTFVDHPDEYQALKEQVQGVKMVRATSPMDHTTIWMEFFHKGVSKAEGIRFVCEREGIENDRVAVIGNDYNDLDMLRAFQSRAFVVNNAPTDLKAEFEVVASVTSGGMSEAVLRTVHF
jgi:Cof subfamily protein (haloacid dehalogenase superfamily)